MRIAIAGATGLIGSQLTALARKEGHEVVEIARETGFDLLAPEPGQLEAALTGADAVVDVTSTGGLLDDQPTLDFFTGVATNLGRAATAAGVPRTVTLSIVGIDEEPRLRLLRAPSSPRSGSLARRAGRAGAARDPVPRLRPADVRVEPRRRRHPGLRRADPARRHPRDRPAARSTWPPARSTTTSSWPGRSPSGWSTSCAVRRPRRLRRDRRAGRGAGERGRAARCCRDDDDVLLRGIDWQTWLERQGR